MSNDYEKYAITDFDFDSPDAYSDEVHGSDGRKHFGHLKMHAIPVEKVYQAGAYITIPGVTGGQYDQQDENGLKKFGGWKFGGKRKLFVFVGTKQDKDGNDYQMVKQFKSALDRGDSVHFWRDHVLPALQALGKAERAKLTGSGVYASWEESTVGTTTLKDRDTGEDKEVDLKAWVNFEVYPSKKAMLEASDNFFAGFSNNGSEPVMTIWPEGWKGAEEEMIAEVKRLNDAETPLAEIVTKALIEGNNLAGEPVDAQEVLATILEIPKPMVKL